MPPPTPKATPPQPAPLPKRVQLNIGRVSPKIREMLRAAAAQQGKTLGQFILERVFARPIGVFGPFSPGKGAGPPSGNNKRALGGRRGMV